MTSRELIAAEANNTDRIALYREGLFWKAYERSAYALCTQVRPFKPTRKILKTLAGGDIVSVGFPTHAADRILAGLRRLDDSSLSCISDASSAAGASDAAVAVSVGADACAAGSVANASAGSCAAPHASTTREPSAAPVSSAADAAGAAGSATRMVLVAPHPIVERDFLAWKSALPISLSIPRPSAAESSCEDPASGEWSAHGLPLLGFSRHEAAPSRGRSLHEVEPLRESSPHEVPRSALRPAFGRAASAGLAAPVGVADSAGSATLAGHAAPAPAATAAPAAQPHWWTRLGGRLVRWAARAGAPRAAAASVSGAAAANAANPASSASAEQCLDALRKFEVADKTPMECMMFIAELKKRFLS